MLVLLVGASGAVGSLIGQYLEAAGHDVIHAGRESGELLVDIADQQSVKALFNAVGKVDAIVSTTCDVCVDPSLKMGARKIEAELEYRVFGQVRLALIGQHFLNEKGSITLTSGILSEEPVLDDDVSAAVANATIEGFVRGAATELRRGLRINAVSPTLFMESVADYDMYLSSLGTVPGERAALAYQRSVNGAKTGRIYNVW